MPTELQILALGAFAGFTIYLGLAIGLRRSMPNALRAFLSALAAGILLFLFYDVVAHANEGVAGQIPSAGGGSGTLAVVYTLIVLVGWAFGFLSLGAFERLYLKRTRGAVAPEEVPLEGAPDPPKGAVVDPLVMSTMIAVGIGLHNLSEGLAIGTAYAGGAIAAGTVLVIGFAAHNSTEGFGILGPGLMGNRRFSPARLLVLGLIGGGPTLLGTMIGSVAYSEPLSILFFGLAAGAIIYVVLQMIRPLMAPAYRTYVWYGVVVGFILGFVTDVVVTFGGA